MYVDYEKLKMLMKAKGIKPVTVSRILGKNSHYMSHALMKHQKLTFETIRVLDALGIKQKEYTYEDAPTEEHASENLDISIRVNRKDYDKAKEIFEGKTFKDSFHEMLAYYVQGLDFFKEDK